MSTDITINAELSFLAILNLLGAAQGLLLTLVLLNSKDSHKTSNRLLAAVTLSISIIVGGAVLLTSNYVFVYPHLSRLHHPFVFAAAPLLYLYIRELTATEKQFRKKDLLHFIPFALCTIYLLPYYFQSSASKINYLVAEYREPSFGRWYYVRSAIFLTQSLVYLVLIVITIVRYAKNRPQRNTDREKAVLFEIRFFVVASVVLWIGAMVRYVTDYSGNLVLPLGVSVLIYAMAYLHMRRPAATTTEKAEPATRKYEKSTLTAERSQKYLERVIRSMEQDKAFNDGELTVQKLADRLAIPAHHLSQTINEGLGQTFFDFINSYRVDEAKRKLVDPACKHLSVLGIAEAVGFTSKSSFNSVFKKHTNMTPSEFRKAVSELPSETLK
jgi:AraC-like DNA-binding protein